MNLEGSRDILTRRNTPEVHLLPQIYSPGKGWRNRPPLSRFRSPARPLRTQLRR